MTERQFWFTIAWVGAAAIITAFTAVGVLAKAVSLFHPPLPVYKDYTDLETGCQLKAVYREGRLTGFNPVWADDNTIAGCKPHPVDAPPE